MKLLAVLSDEERIAALKSELDGLGAELLCYSSVPKAMDNIDEIRPEAVIISAEEFPLVCNVFSAFAAAQENPPRVILDGRLGAKDAEEAFNSGVYAVIDERRMTDLRRFVAGTSTHSVASAIPALTALCFVNPFTGRLETCDGARYATYIHCASPLPGLADGTLIKEVSVRIDGSSIIDPWCRVYQKAPGAFLDYVYMP
jgi:hypothetical protein